MRATACLVVLLHHLAQHVDFERLGPGFAWLIPFERIGEFGVAMFFVLSGFLLSRPFWRARDAGRAVPSLGVYALRRLARIAPGFWLAAGVSFALSVTLFDMAVDAHSVWRLVAGLTFVSAWHPDTILPVELNGPLWSVAFEVNAYLLLPLGFAALFTPPARALAPWAARAAWLGVVAAALLLHTLFVTFHGLGGPIDWADFDKVDLGAYWFPQYNPFGFFAIFAIGALAGGVETCLTGRRVAFDVALAVLLVAIVALLASFRGDVFDGVLHLPYKLYPALPLLLGAVLAVAPHTTVLGRALEPAPVRYVARISFGIYIWHFLMIMLVGDLVFATFTRERLAEAEVVVAASLLVGALTAVAAIASWHGVEKPALDWARRQEVALRGAYQPANR